MEKRPYIDDLPTVLMVILQWKVLNYQMAYPIKWIIILPMFMDYTPHFFDDSPQFYH